ncbi:S8 family serine peptidase [Youngiibacter multivorans]|uniref:Subtilisin family serine protease n=1 Tax=Youngiibacter multivorans TaxID=937251 RepID=A0ABS4G3L4_9CLOT|nr:S8 family serine peptidase [Youngiibacter multivorans]MBP1919135.1 subtilisin family serine protease [Youngiibacter multivorans]
MKGRSKILITSLITALFITTSVIAAASDIKSLPFSDSSGKPQYVEGELLVTYIGTSSIFDKVKVREKHELTKVRDLPLKDTELVKLPKGLTVAQAKAKVAFDPMIKYVQPNFLYYPTVDVNPDDDPHYGILWGLNNTGQLIGSVSGVVDVDIDAPEAWNYLNGSTLDEVVVAVIDTGVDTSHPDLQGKMWVNTKEVPGDGKDNDGNGYVDDINGWNFVNNSPDVFVDIEEDGHATHVSGTIAAVDNTIGVIGIAPNVKIMSLKFLGADGGTTADAIDAINYAKLMGADLSNNSWGGGSYDATLRTAINEFAKPFIVAAGNSKRNIDRVASYPASYDCANIISVAAVDNKGALASFSNYGLTGVDVGAPGVNIGSTYPDNDYVYMSGTSMAAPHVTGVTALVMGANGTLNTAAVKDIIMKSAIANPLLSLAGKTVTGGMINAMKALELAGGTIVDPPPVGDTVAPYVVSSVPSDGAKNFKKANNLVVTFSEGITILDLTRISLVVTNSSVPVAITPSTDVTKLVIDPIATLLSYTKYTLTVSSGAVKDAAGNFNVETWQVSFTTGK